MSALERVGGWQTVEENQHHEVPLDEEENGLGDGPEAHGASAASEAEEQAAVAPLSPEEIALLQQKLTEAEEKAAENLDGWQRALADFSNYKKRLERERAAMREETLGHLVLRYLEVVDDLERALENRPPEGDGAVWSEGIELIYRKLKTFLEHEGIMAIEAEGHEFDPTAHEAISQEPSENHKSGQVIQVVQTGYKLKDRVLRPARVRVAQ